MMTASNTEISAWEDARSGACTEAHQTSVWEETSAWLALCPTLFITAYGAFKDTTSSAIQLTATESDPILHRLTRLVYSLIVLILISTHFRSILAVCKKSKLVLLLPAIALISILWSEHPWATLVGALNLLVTTLFGFFLYVRYPGRRLISFFTFAAFVSLLLCVLSVTAFPTIGIDPRYDGAWRGIFGHKNDCAADCVLFLAVGLNARTRGLVELLIRGSVIFLSLVFIVMSGSRQGWLFAVLAIVLTYALRFVDRIRSLDRLSILLMLSLPLSLAVLFVQSNFTQLLALMGKDPTISQRTIIWEQVMLCIARHPLLGYGYSAFWSGLNGDSMQTVLTTGWSESQAQNGYLDVLLQLGLAGLIPVIIVLLRAFAQTVSAFQRKTMNDVTFLAVVTLTLILVENIGESWLLVAVGMPWLYAIIALLILSRPDRHVEEC